MKVVLEYGQAVDVRYWMDPVAAAAEMELEHCCDWVEFSEQAMRLARESQLPRIAQTFSLKHLQARINTVRSQIASVWNSALPDDEKYRQISTKENEISLLQAGQFSLAKAGLSKVA